MAAMSNRAPDDRGHDYKPGFVSRGLFGTNHKDIGTLYLIFALVGGTLSRRYADYPAALAGWNYVSSVGAYGSGLAFVVILYLCFRTSISKEQIAGNCRGVGATTSKWTQTSPPAFHTYLELPRIL
jgi:heme/copper-type cytochrome/quinol oxidase subunit 1